jgi:hypothetical protein
MNVTLDVVCGTYNNEWMSDLTTRAKDLPAQIIVTTDQKTSMS